MPKATFLFSRHCGAGTYTTPPSAFIRDRLEPMIERASSDGKPLHVIHDMVPTLGLPLSILRDFDSLETNRKFRREVAQTEKRWRLMAKARLERANNGNGSSDDLHFPEGRLILDTNKLKPRTVINHLGFFTSEVVMELACAKSHSIRSLDMLSESRIEEAIDHMVRSIDALASAVLLRDTELVKQLAYLGCDCVVLRNLHHLYLSEIANYSIHVVFEGKPIQMHELFDSHGIELDGEIDGVDLTFSEAAVNRICIGITDRGFQRRDALLDIIFIGIMRTEDLWKKEGGIDEGLKKTLELYEAMGQDLASHDPRNAPL